MYFTLRNQASFLDARITRKVEDISADEDLILPASEGEYILKGSKIVGPVKGIPYVEIGCVFVSAGGIAFKPRVFSFRLLWSYDIFDSFRLALCVVTHARRQKCSC